jgi:hypothetical protein
MAPINKLASHCFEVSIESADGGPFQVYGETTYRKTTEGKIEAKEKQFQIRVRAVDPFPYSQDHPGAHKDPSPCTTRHSFRTRKSTEVVQVAKTTNPIEDPYEFCV